MQSTKPSAPIDMPNEFCQLFGITNKNNFFPEQRQFYYSMALNVKSYRWNEEYKNVKSSEFIRFASEVLPEINQTLDTGSAIVSYLIHAGKPKFSNKIKLIFVMESAISFDPKQFGKIFKRIIRKEGKIGERLTCDVKGLAAMKISFNEYKHLKEHGANPCNLCEKILRDYRKINVNNRSNIVDLLMFTNVLTGLGFALTTTLLFL
ncbi:hypothetical protein PVAND_003493 [Polypedilum vanderplanki]|uniref:Uncharacterized protein n=1 Tax=Polypedilum vanderplanki TaxID=319348 RepID=A0A9J6BU80_POLVA|nr:hypothetical protein PVAND_003493 [Polypedilum vanderplanki]